jgi:hypothetical protein
MLHCNYYSLLISSYSCKKPIVPKFSTPFETVATLLLNEVWLIGKPLLDDAVRTIDAELPQPETGFDSK